MQIYETNPTLNRIFGHEWQRVRRLVYNNGEEMHMAHDICQILDISNVSTGIKGLNGADRVEEPNRWKEQIDDWNRFRKVHFVSLAGVYQIIINNNPRGSAKCRELRYRIGNYLALDETVSLIR